MNDNGSGMEYHTKEDLLKEIGLMIDDCIANGGTYMSFDVNADASCFCGVDDGECPFGDDPSDDCKNCEFGDSCHLVNGDCVDRD
jgi:hypothetical protein